MNIVLFAILVVAYSSARSDETDNYYCLIYDRTAVTTLPSGEVETFHLHMGCRPVPEGQELIRIQWRPVSTEAFRELFIDQTGDKAAAPPD